MTTNLLNNLSNVLKKGPSETQKNPLSCEAQSAAEKSNRVLITCLSRVNHLIQYRCMRYAALLLVLLLAGIGNAWADTEIYSQTFTSWSSESISAGGSSHSIYFKSATTVTNGTGVVFGGNGSTSQHFMSIPLENVNGSITVTITSTSAKHQYNYSIETGTSAVANKTTAPSMSTSTKDGSNTTTHTFTISSLTASHHYARLYIAPKSSDDRTVKAISITTPAAASTWKLKGSFDSWGDGYAMSGSGTVSVTRTLTANTRYEFKIVDGSTYYGNGEVFGGTKTQSVSSTGTANNCHLLTTEAGDYTFSFNTSTKDLTITYPNSYTFYYANTGSWSKVYVYKFTSNGSTGNNTAWPGVEIASPTYTCGGTDYYATTSDGYAKLIFTNNGGGDSNQTSDMVVSSSDAGKYTSGNKGAGTTTWTAFPTYTVTYNKNGDGAGGAGSVTGSVPTDSNSPYACGSTVTVLGNTGSLALDGYTFAGWNTAPGGGGTSYAANATFTISANTTLYAQWEENASYSVTYNANGATGSVPTDANTYANGEEVTVLGKNTLAKTNYGFAGWRTAVSSGTWYVQGQTFEMGSANVNLYAQWVAEASMVSGTLYKAVDMKASAASATGQYRAGISANGIFEVLGVGVVDATTGPMEYGSDSRTIDGTAFTEALHFKGTGSGSPSGSTLPTTRAIKFRVPAAGTLHLWVRAGSKIAIVKDGGSASAVGSSTDRTHETAAVTAGTYYLYATGTSVSLYGLQFVQSCTAPSALTAASPTAKGATLTVTDANDVNNYEFYVSTSSTAPEAGATATHSVSSAKSLTITNLVAGTQYYAWARSVCGVSNKSGWTALTGTTFTTSTVSASYNLTNVNKSTGATSGIGGSDFTATFAGATDYNLPSTITVTIDGNTATAGDDYTWTVGTGTLTIPANKINGNIVITLNSAPSAPSSAVISGTYHYFPGDNISLTCTPSGNNGPTTYQWYKGGKSDEDNLIDGATSATYTKNDCAFGDAGSYYCKVTCNATSIWAVTNSHENYDVKILRLYVNGSKSGDPYGNVDFEKVSSTTATASIALGSNWTYGFNIADGCGHYYGNAGTMLENNCTNWVTNVNGTDCGLTTTNAATYIFTINYSNLEMITTSVTYPVGNQASGKVIYFDNNVLDWTGSSIYYRIGHSSHSQASQLSLVNGTANLYKMTTSEYNGFSGWHIANATGDVGSGKSIYKTVDGTPITEATAHEGGAVTATAITVTPTTSRGNGADVGVNDNCEFFNYAITSGMKTDNVAISDYSNGTITVNYTNTSNEAATLTSGNADLAHSVILTSITAVPNTGYDASAITINGGAYSANYVVTGATTIAASFTPHVYNITYKDQGDVAFSGTHVDSPNAHPTTHTYATATTLNSATKTGYTFGGWFTNSACTGDAVTSLGATAYSADITLYAKWTVNSHTLTWDFDGGSSSEAAGEDYTAGGSVNYGTTINYPSNGSMSKSGYVFDGWSTDVSTMPDENLTITAQWALDVCFTMEANSSASSNVELAKKEAISSGSKNCSTLSGGTARNGNYGTLAVEKLSSGHYGWKFGSTNNDTLVVDLTGTKLQTGSIITVSGYAGTSGGGIRINNCTIYTKPSSSGAFEAQSYTVKNTDTDLVGKHILKIQRVSSSTVYLSAISISNCADRPTYNVTYKANGGVSATGEDVVHNVSEVEGINDVSFTRAGYDFDGWKTGESSGTSYAVGDDVPSALTLYAQWSCVTPTIGTDLSTSQVTYRQDASADALTVAATANGSGGNGTVSYQWYSNTANSTTTPTPSTLIGQTSASYTPSTASVGTTYYFCVMTNSSSGCSTTATSKIAKIVVEENPCFEFVSGSTKSGSAPKLPVAAGGTFSTEMWTDGSPVLTGGTLTNSSASASIDGNAAQAGLVIDSDDKQLTVTLSGNNIFTIGTVITIKAKTSNVGAGDDKNKYSGFKVGTHDLSGSVKCTSNTPADFTQTYTVVAEDGINGTNSVVIKRLASGAKNYLHQITVTGCGERSTYTVTYDADGASQGSVPVDGNEYEENDEVTISDNTGWLFKSGYDFGGWKANVNLTIDAATVTAGTTIVPGKTFSMPSSDVTLTAVWTSCTKPGTPSRPSIDDGTLAHNGARFAWDPTGATAHSNGYVVSVVKVSDGSTVLDWTSEGIGSDVSAAGIYHATGLDELTEYHFIVRAIGDDGYCAYGDTSRLTFGTLGTPYTITYHLNGASWINEGAATYHHGTGYTLPVASDMSNTGYTFDGWYDNSGLTGSAVTEISAEATGNKEYWAKWTENEYDVTYNANGGSGDAMSATHGHYVTISDNSYTAPSGKAFVEWNTANDGSGASYNPGDEIELTANLPLYAIWADDYTITWEASAKQSGVAVTPNLGGGNYTITADVGAWNGTLTTSMISAVTDGVTITNVAVDNSASPKTITATFNVGASVAGTSITLELDVPAYGDYAAKSSTKEITIDRCTGSSSGTDGVLFSAEFKDSGLGTSNICAAANTAYTFTTAELKSAPTGGSIKAYTTSNLNHMKFATDAISIAGSDGVIQIDLDNAIATNDLFTYVNVNSSTSAAYLRHTSADNTTDQIALTVYNSKEVKVMLPAGYDGKTTLYVVRNNSDFKLHKAAVVRPAFLMLLRDDTPTSDTNLEGTDAELTTGNYLATIQGGRAYYTSPSSGNLKIKRSNSKNYINFNNAAGYVKIVLNDALQEGDVIGFDSYNTNNLAFTATATRSTDIVTTNQLYTVNASSALKGKTTFYIWQNSGSSDFLRGLQIARSGIAGGGGGTDQITPTLTWTPALNTDADWDSGNNRLNKETGDADFTYTVTQDKNSLGAISYSSSNTSVATVNATSGKVHIVGGGDATITATIAESGCYEEATATYAIHVVDNCDDVAGTIEVEDLGCEDGYRMTVTGHIAAAGVSYQWYKVGSPDTEVGTNQDNYTTKTAGEYYVIVTNTGDGHCSMVSANTITITASVTPTATKIVNSWYIKNGRRTPDIALVQTTNAENFQVKKGEVVIWDTKESVTTGYAGCSFYLATDGIIYLMGQKPDESAPSGLTAGDETLKFIVSSCGGTAETVSITIHKQEATTRPSVAFVVDGTKEGTFDAENEDHSVNTALYQFLDYGSDSQGAFDLTGQNVYSTVDEKAIREHYSQFDAILITDDPSTDTKIGKVSCVNAFGTMIDVRPILTMEAFVSKWSNWKAKGIDGNPSSPNPRQYAMKLDCKNHAIFVGIDPASSNVLVEDIDGVEYWTVTMVDKTQSPYSGVADDTDTDGKPALQGFSASDVSSLMLLGEISNGTLYAGVERQEEAAARLLLLGLNNKALPNALTPEGKKIIENSLTYLLETDMEKVDDCSNYFTDAAGDKQWNNAANWTKGIVPNSPYVKARILKPCVLSGLTAKVARVDIASSGKSLHLSGGECSGSLTIDPTGALISGGAVRSAEAPYFNMGDLMPTEEDNLILNTSSTNQAALIFNNDKGDTKATVNLYSLGRKVSETNQFQYMAIPMGYLPVSPSFANETYGGIKIYTYVWLEASGWERRGYYADLYAFEGVGITTDEALPQEYTMKGTLTSTKNQEIPITAENKKLNLIGNSWTAPIQISELEASDFGDASSAVEQTVYIYCTGHGKSTADGSTEAAGQWLAIPFNATDFAAWEGLKVIPSMQSFQIKTTGAGTLTLDYKKHVRGGTTDLTAKLRAPKRKVETDGVELMRIRVADSQTHTDLYLFEGDQFTDEFDNGWEANYRVGTSESAKLYARVATGVMSVAAMPSLESTPVYFIPGQETEYMFTFGGEGMGYYLNDIKMQRSTLISTEATYSFTYEKGDAAARFYISKTPIDAGDTPTGVSNTDATPKAQKFIYQDKLYILRNGALYDATGKKVNSK